MDDKETEKEIFEKAVETVKEGNYEDLIKKGAEEQVPEDSLKKETEDFLKLREKLKNAKDQVEKQQGLAYKFGIKKKNPASNDEYKKLSEEYKRMTETLRIKGLNVEDIIKNAKKEGGKEVGNVEKAEAYIKEKEKEVQAKVEQLTPQKRELFNKIKALAKDRRVQLIVGGALVGIAITCPPAAVLTGGLVQGFLPYSLAPLAKGLTAAGGGFLMRGFLKERNKKKEGGAPETNPKPTPEPGPKPTPDITPKPTPETQPAPSETTPETKPTPGATPETTPGATPETQPAPSETTPETKPTPGATTPGTTPEAQPGNDLEEDLPDHLAGRFGNIKEMDRVGGDPDQLAGRFGNVEELIRKKQEFEEQKKAEEEIATEMPNSPEVPTPEEIEAKYNEFEERRQIEEEIATEMPNSPEVPTPEEAEDKFKKIKEVEEDEEERAKEMHD